MLAGTSRDAVREDREALRAQAGEDQRRRPVAAQLQSRAERGRVDVDAALLDLESPDAALAQRARQCARLGREHLAHAEARHERARERGIRRQIGDLVGQHARLEASGPHRRSGARGSRRRPARARTRRAAGPARPRHPPVR